MEKGFITKTGLEKTRQVRDLAFLMQVIIVAKGGKNEHDDCLGARMAAKKLYPKAEPKCLAYEFVTPEVLQGTTDELRSE